MQIEPHATVRTVTQITTEIKLMLEGQYRFIAVGGEISNLRTPFSGHHYFTLKDENAQIRAVMFKGQQRYLAEKLRDGQQVICRGRISVYEPRGEYQLIVDTIDHHGLGVLQMQFAALKKKLSEEGLFDVSSKKLLPDFPQKIVVVTSPTGAAIQDFLKICKQRKTSAHIQVYPVAVQGDKAAGEIARALSVINRKIPCDMIVLCRGGGSLEDLWAFNEEIVARAIYASRLPVLTGIGHEIDTTIADLCADVRAATPTGAAEMIISDSEQLGLQLLAARNRLRRTISNSISQLAGQVQHQSRVLANFHNRLETLSLRVDLSTEKFQRAGYRFFNERERHLKDLNQRLNHQAPLNQIALQQQRLGHLHNNLTQHIQRILQKNRNSLAKSAALLQGVSPLSTLARGYSIVQKKDERTGESTTINSAKQVTIGENVNVLLHEGELLCEVLAKTES
ncbi:exodeoxyribonuclease VII large subunit [Desulfosediminicola ganghwensis]|uniref:exodeoxyribonuclease VII large subunit n=1 Tax=Desulfosediminicola ganghwensis TaxID=2569540 RepID=UPI00142F1A10|nr:exodeoxyribonuclease VII large subunit [Desulfosediminicola ganghwensis]